MYVDDRIRGHVDAHQLVCGIEQVGVTLEERRPAHDEVTLKARRRVMSRARKDVLLPRLEDQLGFGERGAATPALDQPWIAGGRQRAGAEVGAHEDRVDVDRTHPRLRLRQLKPPGTKPVSRSNSRITHASAPPRDSDTRYRRLSGLELVRTGPHPVLALGVGERVESSNTCHSSARTPSTVVRRHSPRGFASSFQKL